MAQMRMHGLANANASLPPGAAPASTAMSGGFGSSDVVAEARRYIGGNPTSRRSLWCARFMNMVLHRSGHRGTGSDMANSFAHYGQRVVGPADRRHRGDGKARRRTCRRGQRHRRARQPDPGLRQQPQPRCRSPGLAPPDLHLRHADRLRSTPSRQQRGLSRWRERPGGGPVGAAASGVRGPTHEFVKTPLPFCGACSHICLKPA